MSTGREANAFAGEQPSVTIAAHSWRAEKLDGTLTWSLLDLSTGEPGKTAIKTGTVALSVADVPVAQVVPLPVPRLGLYRLDADIAWKDGGKDARQVIMASIGAVPKDDDASRDASPYGLNTHGGGSHPVVDAWSKAGIRWIRDYAWGFGGMLHARDGNGNFTGWPWYPKILARYQKAGLRILPCFAGDCIPAVTGDGDVKVPTTWRRDVSAILSAFPDIAYWELGNEWDLDWEDKRNVKADRARGWPQYRAYHKAFGQLVSAMGGIAVENGRAGVHPEEVKSFVTKGDFDGIQVVNGHYYTGISAPENAIKNENTGGGGAVAAMLCYPDLLREASRASSADGKQRSFWLTEFGWDTKAGPIVSNFQQAVYLQRGWLASFANGVDKSFWFYDFDAPVGKAFFDGCGIMDHLVQPKLSYCALAALTRVLPNPKYLGPLDAGPGTWGYLFEDHGTLVAALGTIEQIDGPTVDFASGTLSDFLGNPVAGKKAKLGMAPIFCVGVARDDRWVKQACYENDGLRLFSLAAGDKVEIPIAVTNHRAAASKATLTLRLPKDWAIIADKQAVEAAAGAKAKGVVAFTISPKAVPGEYEAVVQIDEGGALCEHRVRVLVGAALTVSAPALGNQPGTTPIEISVLNRSQRALDGTVTPRLPAGWKAEPAEVKLTQLAPGAKLAVPFKITWDASWKPGEEAWAEVATTDGVATRVALQPGVITIPRLAKYVPDGELGEWPATSLLPNWVIGVSGEGAANAEVRLAWQDNGLALAVSVKDSRLLNTDPRAFWDMDATEVFLDSTGTPAARAFAPTDHQFWLIGLPAEKRVFLGRWKRGTEIPDSQFDIPGVTGMAKQTADGYIFEAVIPAAAISGFAAKAGTTIGLDLILTINGKNGRREVYWPWGKQAGVASKPELWGRVRFAE
ncbi:MAG: hypothetical protein H0W72_09165 [Planctomycetes bacterium]|nr:hypothetical protein [Planctomycetota bacterium]